MMPEHAIGKRPPHGGACVSACRVCDSRLPHCVGELRARARRRARGRWRRGARAVAHAGRHTAPCCRAVYHRVVASVCTWAVSATMTCDVVLSVARGGSACVRFAIAAFGDVLSNDRRMRCSPWHCTRICSMVARGVSSGGVPPHMRAPSTCRHSQSTYVAGLLPRNNSLDVATG